MIPAVRHALTVCCYILLITLGLYWLADSMLLAGVIPQSVAWTPMRDVLPQTGAYGLAFGSVLVLLPLMVISLRSAENALYKRIMAKADDGSEISLSPQAVERTLVREALRTVPEVTALRAIARQGKDAPKVLLEAEVSDRERVPDVQKKLKLAVQSNLQRLFGVADVSQVRVSIVGLRDVRPRAAALPEPEPESASGTATARRAGQARARAAAPKPARRRRRWYFLWLR